MLTKIGKTLITTRVDVNIGRLDACAAIVVNKMLLLLVVTLLSFSVFGHVHGCGYASCPKFEPHKLNIHIVSHSHDDVGWLKTPQVYYKDQVRHILDNVVAELGKHSHRRFVQVETFYLWKWWSTQPESVKQTVHKLVKSGQLSFANGGWSMNDGEVIGWREIDEVNVTMTLSPQRRPPTTVASSTK